MTKSKDRVSDVVNGHASRPYNKAGMHLLLISCIMNVVYKENSYSYISAIIPL